MTDPKPEEVTRYLESLTTDYGGSLPTVPLWAKQAQDHLLALLYRIDQPPPCHVIPATEQDGAVLLALSNWLRYRGFQLGFILGRESAARGWDDSLLSDVDETVFTGDRRRAPFS